MNRIETFLNLPQAAVELGGKTPGLPVLATDANTIHLGAGIRVAIRNSPEGTFTIGLSSAILADNGFGTETFQLVPHDVPLRSFSFLLGFREPDRIGVTARA